MKPGKGLRPKGLRMLAEAQPWPRPKGREVRRADAEGSLELGAGCKALRALPRQALGALGKSLSFSGPGSSSAQGCS